MQLQQRKIEDTTTHNLVEADATGVPAEKCLNFAGCEIFFSFSRRSQVSKMKTMKVHLEIEPLMVPIVERLYFYSGVVLSPGIRRPDLVTGRGNVDVRARDLCWSLGLSRVTVAMTNVVWNRTRFVTIIVIKKRAGYSF